MKKLLGEFIELYDSKRTDFIGDIRPIKPIYQEVFKWSLMPKIETIIEKESKFYSKIISEMSGLQKIREKNGDKITWDELLFVMKNHNERLSCNVDNFGALATVYALLSGLIVILAQNLSLYSWFAFPVVIMAAIQAHDSRVTKRHELSRNKEFINIIERYLESQKI